MNDRLANQIATYRARLLCLDQAEHRPLWEGRPPLAFTEKVGEARALTSQLIDIAARQSAPTRGITRDKARRAETLIGVALALGRGVVVFCRDHRLDGIGGRHDFTRREWLLARDETLLGRARTLVADATELAAGPHGARAADFGIHAEGIARLAAAAYEAMIAAPQGAIDERKALTASLPVRQREVKAKFAELDDLAPQLATTPEGAAFVAAFRASRQIVDRGKGRAPGDADETPPEDTPAPES